MAKKKEIKPVETDGESQLTTDRLKTKTVDDTNLPSKPETQTIATFKGFDNNLRCRGFQFEVGKTYTVTGEIKACSNGFHACEHPLNVFDYYPPATSRYAEVEQSGAMHREGSDTKIASASITIKAELRLPDLIARARKWVFDRATPEPAASATGEQGAASATGDRGAASATGDRGAASATGEQGAASATGYQGAASATGYQGVALAAGYEGRAMATASGAICVVCRNDEGDILAIRASKVGENGVKPDTWYSLSAAGDFLECA